mgnify:CR=1 FL=1
MFTEVQLGFQCDANMTPLKYLNDWYGSIFGEIPSRTGTTFGNRPSETLRHNRTNKLRRPDTYCKTIRITKTMSIVDDSSNVLNRILPTSSTEKFDTLSNRENTAGYRLFLPEGTTLTMDSNYDYFVIIY